MTTAKNEVFGYNMNFLAGGGTSRMPTSRENYE